ncbi:type 3 dihydrofolate reductase [Candidatus Woesearchaeota archaeon]|nr:type 3 dihydrofolate reductase [Candidatus Woesearchaeota archaeon]
MIISLIAAMDKNRVIGKGGKLPWNLPADMKYFKDKTLGKPIIMGRKTYESLGKPLPNRTNIIITRDRDYKAEGCIVVHSAEEALKAAEGDEEVMIIGGSQIYKELLPKTNRMYLTIVDADFEGDTFFPEYDVKEWKETAYEEHERDAENQYNYTFLILEKVS